jgi:uracil-DNA glycosylase family 4
MADAFQFELFDDPSNRVLNAGSYGEFRRLMAGSGCRKCGLAAGRTSIVIDRGNPASKLLLVGEGPGQQEDLTGRAFVGRAGKLLDEIMAAVHLDTERDMLIANVVKCRPPENRTPQREEAASCLPYLRKQIDLVRPDCILLLGATAARHLFPDRKLGSMEEEVGKFFDGPEYPGIKFMLLYHPAYLLRDPRKKKDMGEHVKTFNRWWTSGERAGRPA